MRNKIRSNKLAIVTVILIALFIMIAGPLFLEIVIFRNSFKSVLSNAEWSSFLGSFIGGILGGAGTLIAVYVSLNHTIKLQDKLEERIKNDKLKDEIYKRKLFCDVVAEDVSNFIKYASKLYYGYSIRNTLLKRKHILIDKLDVCDTRILEIIEKRKKYSKMVSIWRFFAHSTDTSLIKDELEQLNVEKSIFQRELFDLKEQLDHYNTDDSMLINYSYLLEIKLSNIFDAEVLLRLLNETKSECYRADEQDEFWIEEQIKEITSETKKFIINYMDIQ